MLYRQLWKKRRRLKGKKINGKHTAGRSLKNRLPLLVDANHYKMKM